MARRMNGFRAATGMTDAAMSAMYGDRWKMRAAGGALMAAGQLAVPVAAGVIAYRNRDKIKSALRSVRNRLRSGRAASNAAQV